MLITMKLDNHSMNFYFALLIFIVSNVPSFAGDYNWNDLSLDTTLTCNDLVQISLDENCLVLVNPDMILEGFEDEFNDYSIDIIDEVGYPVPNPTDGTFLGDTIYVTVNHLPSGQSCWGRAIVKDKWAPQLTCSNYTFNCFESPDNFPDPDVWDNCDSSPDINVLSENIDKTNICDSVIITRVYQATDESGNQSNICEQTITTYPPITPEFPQDTVWTCLEYEAHPNIIQAKSVINNINLTGSGIPDVSQGDFCPYNVTHTDFMFTNGCGNTFTIIRTWTVINWCTDEIFTAGLNNTDNVQVITIEDFDAPIISRPDFTINANIGTAQNEECGSVDLLLPPLFIDDCHSVTVKIFTGIGEAIYLGADGSNGGYVPHPGLPIGVHNIIYWAQDACGNTDTTHVTVTVKDQTPPVVVCDELTNVSLGLSGLTSINASVFDDGSRDNCCLDSFQVRRMSFGCLPTDTIFQDSVVLCCADVGDTVQVILQANDCEGNSNECMVLVQVEEKLQPNVIFCPDNVTIDCEYYIDSLEIALSENQDSVLNRFGQAEFLDNCIANVSETVTINLDQCLQGDIIRRWVATDNNQNTSLPCQQRITVEHFSDWLVEFPADVEIECGIEIPDTGEPTIFYESCEMIAIAYEDEIFTVVPDVCFEIARTWTAINWCLVGTEIDNPLIENNEFELNFDLDGDDLKSKRLYKDGLNLTNFDPLADQFGSQPDGVVVYQQKIRINDSNAPVVNCSPKIEICIEDTTCMVTFELPIPEILDCGYSIETTANGDLGTGLGPFIDVEIGEYNMTYQANDNCGNNGFCETLVKVIDCKKPTPFCKDGLIIEIDEDSVIIVNAHILNDGSFDNCDGELIFSFSTDISDSLALFNCSTLGFQSVDIWVTDASGNQDFCETSVFVEDNNLICSGEPLISGVVMTSAADSIPDVSIHLNNHLDSATTNIAGEYQIPFTPGQDYSITADKSGNPLNGITTYDIVLISKHILGIKILDDPYKIIAADANLSNTVTTADIVTLRKLILQINTEFPSGQSWRFIDRNHVFPNPNNPFETVIPEFINFNNLGQEVKDADLIGVKIGDINFSASF